MINNFFTTDFLNKFFFGNTFFQYLTAILLFLILAIFLKILQKIILNRLEKIVKKTKNDLDDIFIKIFFQIKPSFYFLLALYFSLKTLILPSLFTKIINSFFILVIIFQLDKTLREIINFVVNKFNKEEGSEEHNENISNILGTIIIFFVWAGGILMILSNLGVDISSLLAGVGIGGVAIAFALKEILADLFASISIYFDKPFKVGDLISVKDKTGVVEKIGLKTTRIRANSKEEIIFSNKELTSSCIQNFKKNEKKEIKFSVKISKEVSLEKLEKVNEILIKIIKNVENAEFSKSYFKNIDDEKKVFEIVYLVNQENEDLNKIQQEINLEICKEFEKEKIEIISLN